MRFPSSRRSFSTLKREKNAELYISWLIQISLTCRYDVTNHSCDGIALLAIPVPFPWDQKKWQTFYHAAAAVLMSSICAFWWPHIATNKSSMAMCGRLWNPKLCNYLEIPHFQASRSCLLFIWSGRQSGGRKMSEPQTTSFALWRDFLHLSVFLWANLTLYREFELWSPQSEQ